MAFNRPSPGVLPVDQIASEFEQTTKNLQNEIGASEIGLRFFNSDNVARINSDCPWTPKPECESLKKNKFRTMDGSCNNLRESNYGRAKTPFQRITDPEYAPKSLGAPRYKY